MNVYVKITKNKPNAGWTHTRSKYERRIDNKRTFLWAEQLNTVYRLLWLCSL